MSQPLDVNAAIFAGSTPWVTFRRTLVTVFTDATPLPTTALENRKGIWVFNVGTINCFLGLSANLASSNEPTLYAAQDRIITATDQLTVYGRTASGTATVVVWEYA